MGSTSKEKMDALKQTIKSLRSRRDHLEQVVETAEQDAQEQYIRYTHLDEQFKAERLHRTKLEEHLRSLGVEVDEYGNIKGEGDPETPEIELMNDASPRATSSTPPEHVHVKLEKNASETEPTNDASPVASSLPVTVKIEKGVLNSQTEPTNDAPPVASSPPVTVKIERGVTTLTGENIQQVANNQPEDPTPVDIKVKKGKKDDYPQPLPLDVRARFLKGASLFPITPDPLPVAVGRYALNKAYRAPTVAMSWTKDGHRFLWPSFDWNPDMPRGVGEPGLLLEVYPIYCDGNTWSLFYKILQSNPVLWGYAGEYIGREAGKLWKEEYAALGEIVHTTRATQMLRNRTVPDAGSQWQRIKARIVLRKQLPPGVEPSEEQIEAELPNLTLDVSQEYPPDYLTCQDITDAFVRGDEHLVVSRLECVAYDHAKAQEFIDIQKRYLETKVKKSRKVTQKRKDTTPLHENPDAEPSEAEEKSPRPPKRIKLEASAKPKPGPSNSTATSHPPTPSSSPSSSRSVRARVKSRKLLGLD